MFDAKGKCDIYNAGICSDTAWGKWCNDLCHLISLLKNLKTSNIGCFKQHHQQCLWNWNVCIYTYVHMYTCKRMHTSHNTTFTKAFPV